MSRSGATSCPARTRLYRGGKVVAEGFPVEEISDRMDDGAVVWLDLRSPGEQDMLHVSEEFGLHPLAVEDAGNAHQRPKLDRYDTHLFLNMYAARLDDVSGELVTSEVSAFILRNALITVRKDDSFNIDVVLAHWDASPELAVRGVPFLVYGLVDAVVDGHFTAVQSLDEAIEELEDRLFDPRPEVDVQRRSFELRKSLVLLRRIVLPMREVVNSLMRRDLHVIDDQLTPYYQDVYDHVLRATEWTEGLRDLVATILETNLSVQSNQLNEITKKLAAWAALIAVPTAITGFYGQNVPYPGFGREWGLETSSVLIVVLVGLLYLYLKKRDYL